MVPKENYAKWHIELFQKKSKQGDGVVCGDMEIPEVLEKDHVEISGLSSNGSGISRGVQEKLMLNFLVAGSSFLNFEFPRDNMIFCNFEW